MKILILSRYPQYYSTKRLVKEAQKLHHKAQVIDPLQCDISIASLNPPNPPLSKGGIRGDLAKGERGGFIISTGRQNLSDFDVVIPRIGIIGIDYALQVLQQFELLDVPLLNSSSSLGYAKNKFQCLQMLARAGIPVPQTIMTHNLQEIPGIIKELGGLPLILKLFRGSQGKGVIMGENIAAIKSILTAVWALGYDIILQKYLSEPKGADIRILVLGDEVIATMKRTPPPGEFRSNIHQGGTIKKITASPEEKELSIKSAGILGLNLAGVDIMRTKNGPAVLEVNASPGFEGLENVTGINIARRITEFTTLLKPSPFDGRG